MAPRSATIEGHTAPVKLFLFNRRMTKYVGMYSEEIPPNLWSFELELFRCCLLDDDGSEDDEEDVRREGEAALLSHMEGVRFRWEDGEDEEEDAAAVAGAVSAS